MFVFMLQVAKSIEVYRWGLRTKTQLGRQGGADKATGVISGAIFAWFVMVVVDYTCDLHVYV